MSTSVREYAILYVGKGGKGGSSTIGGGNAILNAGQHALDGPEHTAASDGVRLDASTAEHGLLPKLSGVTSDVLGGDGVFRAETPGGMVPFYIPTGETFRVPANRQGLYHAPITVDGGLVVDGILIGV